ncbi:nucleotide disphospho-sugar-binding domain-containing protein [Actinomadura montaniterrae]|uniref:DUF1205 domain-containing protein n=1 Tax=Actinomadura montaniterrae TaxID=1803903 RepID=A0A6L3W5B9_9ACTN|nr:nucleotide disphospho-sugar-binding domain-containing protein [Actinomadura montaniterrae]KAB2390036.1 DUF1205 domain-containing protein [Actinomadura montaniterrae]
MRVLMLSTPFPTHFTPMVPLAWALRGAGHDVAVAGQPDVTDAAHAAGLPTVVIGERFHASDIFSRKLPAGKRPLELMGPPTPELLASTSRMWEIHARYLVPRYLEFARDWRPDLIVTEQMEFAGRMIGGVLGVPVVAHRWFIDPLSGPTAGSVRAFLHGASTRLGLEDGLPEPDLILDPCPPKLQVPGLPEGLPIRPVPSNGSGPLPGWALRPRIREHRVCVSLGNQTIALNGMPLLKNIIAGIARLPDVEAIVTAATEFHPEPAEVPDQVKVVPPTPLNQFLHTCDAVVHHGGAGSSLTATAMGVPQLVLPQMVDQFPNALRLADSGAAIAVESAAGQDDPGVVAGHLRELLTEPSWAAAAAELKAAADAMPSPAQVVPRLEALAATGRHATDGQATDRHDEERRCAS